MPVTHIPGLDVLTRRKIARRLLPFAFTLYVIAQLDRINVSFAILRMKIDLGFTDQVYGLGIALFYLGYFLFEVPGAVIVEHWSARKWMARILISWGIITIFSGLVQTAVQFYATRFLLGLAEASFFPGMIVYFTHWFRQSDRGRAVAFLYAAVPVSAVLGAALASWLLAVAWLGLAGWRWLIIVEGVPAVVFGFIALFYMTDWPAQARWLTPDEREWISSELQAEKTVKARAGNFTIWQALRDRRTLILLIPYLLANVGTTSIAFWLPTFVKRYSGLPNNKVAQLVLLPAVAGLFGLINGWHSDKTGERRLHTAVPLTIIGISYLSLMFSAANFPISMALFTVGGIFLYAYYPAFWAIPAMILSDSAAAAAFGLINGTGHLGGFFGPYVISYLSDRTHSLLPGFAFIGSCYLVAALLITRMKIPDITAPGRIA